MDVKLFRSLISANVRCVPKNHSWSKGCCFNASLLILLLCNLLSGSFLFEVEQEIRANSFCSDCTHSCKKGNSDKDFALTYQVSIECDMSC